MGPWHLCGTRHPYPHCPLRGRPGFLLLCSLRVTRSKSPDHVSRAQIRVLQHQDNVFSSPSLLAGPFNTPAQVVAWEVRAEGVPALSPCLPRGALSSWSTLREKEQALKRRKSRGPSFPYLPEADTDFLNWDRHEQTGTNQLP